MKNNSQKLLKYYAQMYRIREVEKKISNNYPKNEIRCPIHLSIGQEAVAVGVCSNLKKTDQVFSTHRCHAHYLAKGGNLKSMISELYGKENGCSQGKAGSMHLTDLNAGMIASVPIVGSSIPIAAGMAWANKLKKNKKIVVVFFGEGATEQGVFYETLNFASMHKLPIIFICENNLYSVYTRIEKRQSSERNLVNIAKSIGLVAQSFFGNDVIKISKIVSNFKKKILKGYGPSLLELKTYRTLEHCGPFSDDHLNYRSKNEINYWSQKCPLITLKNKILNKTERLSVNEKLKKIEKKIDIEIKNSFEFAKKSKFPKKNLLKKYIYAK